MELDDEACGPYDNVEFPIRQPGTGTWPRANSNVTTSSSSSSTSSAAGNKLFGQHSLRTSGPRLAPLMEVDTAPDGGENTRAGTTSTAATSVAATNNNSSTSSPQSHLHANSVTANNKTSQSNQIQGNKIVSASTVPTATTGTSATNPSSTPSPTSAASPSSSTSTATSTKSKQSPRPVISMAHDSSNYAATRVTASTDTLRKKNSTLKQMSVEDEDFKRHDLNPGSRLALERVYICHPDFYQLNSKILDEGSLLKQDVNEIYRKSGETLTYEQLLQGMMVDGERFLLGGCWLYFSYVQFLDIEGTKILREPYRRGRVGLTSKRALFLSTETFTDASLEPYGDPSKAKAGGFKLEVSKQSNVLFKNIPLTNFHSAEMEVISGTSAQTKITKGSICCGWFSRPGKWLSTAPMTRSVNSRVLRVGVSMPPWQTRMFMDIHLDPTMSLTTARDFIAQLHQFAPHIN